MRIAFFSTHKFEKEDFSRAKKTGFDLTFLEARLTLGTVSLALGHDGVCIFENDDGTGPVFEKLKNLGVRYLLLRSAGFNHVAIETAESLGIKVARVPAYSSYAVAALITRLKSRFL